MERLVTLLQSAGGSLRFDEYMQENLFNPEEGFYEHVRIREGGDFTTHSRHPLFARLLSLYIQDNFLHEDFLEIGGGNGKFKKNYQRFSEGNYVSIDASKHLLAKQGENTLQANAEYLPLKDECVDGVIFSNELFDALPCRVFRIDEARITGEAYIELEESPEYVFKPTERDSFVELYETFLRQSRPDRKGVVSVSQLAPIVLSEMYRVLKKGRIMVIDYGYLQTPTIFEQRDEEHPAHFGEKYYVDFGGPVPELYTTDITYRVDFDFLVWLSERASQSTRVRHQHNFFMQLVYRHLWVKNEEEFNKKGVVITSPTDCMVMEISK